MVKSLDLVGSKFNRWTVIKRVENKHGKSRWICVCDCGTKKELYGESVKSGGTISCGCYQKDNPSRLTHGGRHTRLYNVWSKMKARCSCEKWHAYNRYGGRGIKVCQEWAHDFVAFRDWAFSNGYNDDLELDRKDNDGDYCPDNCQWLTHEQNKKKEAIIQDSDAADIRSGNTDRRDYTRLMATKYGVSISYIWKILRGINK